MSEFKLSVKLINAIISYLSKRPYDEVYELIAQVHLECNKQKEEANGDKKDIESK
jgi:hypothetical protein